ERPGGNRTGVRPPPDSLTRLNPTDAPQGSEKTGPTRAPPPVSQLAVPLAPVLDEELFALTPPDTEGLAWVDLRPIGNSQVFKRLALEACRTALKDTPVRRFLDAAGLDPLRDLDSIILTMAGIRDPRVLVVIRGRVDEGKVAPVLEAEARK